MSDETGLSFSDTCGLFLQQRPNDYGIPVAVEVTYVQDNFLTSDVLNEMV